MERRSRDWKSGKYSINNGLPILAASHPLAECRRVDLEYILQTFSS